LFWRRLWLAGIFTLMLLSLAGIPLTAGFFAKFYVIAAGVASGLWLLVLFLIINSVIGLFYYLRVIVAMAAAVRPVPALMSWSWAEHVALAMLAALLIWLGIYPAPMIRLIQALGSSISG
jgi:NADH-quinone oxidoreductase subunit N